MTLHVSTCLEDRPVETSEQEVPVTTTERIRWDLVHRVRQEIEAGTYDTEEKLELALEEMLASMPVQ